MKIKDSLWDLWEGLWPILAYIAYLPALIVGTFSFILPFTIGYMLCLFFPCEGWPHTKELSWPWKHSPWSVFNTFRPLTRRDWGYIGIMWAIGMAIMLGTWTFLTH